jgi:hypothetical protein
VKSTYGLGWVVIANKSLTKYVVERVHWTDKLSEARRFLTRAEARRFRDLNHIDGVLVFIENRREG